jgi:hypothetical protein
MPAISSNDVNVITINGKRLNAQGVARLKESVSSEDAATKLKGAGFDEMIFSTTGPDGKPERLVAWGDTLDFSFRNKRSIPNVTVDGNPASMIAFSNEPVTLWRGTLRGVVDGIKNAFDAIEGMAKNSIAGVAVASGAAMLGSTVWVVASRGAALDLIKTAVLTFGPGLASAVGALSFGAIGLVIIAGAVKGGMTALNGQPKMEAIAGVIDDRPPALPGAAAATPATPATPAEPLKLEAPTPSAPAAKVTPPANKLKSVSPAAATPTTAPATPVAAAASLKVARHAAGTPIRVARSEKAPNSTAV